jgi:hypothetical protein
LARAGQPPPWLIRTRLFDHRERDWIMKALLGSAAVVFTLLLFSDGGLAQGACAKACGDANARYQRACSDAGAACQRQAGGNPRYVAACQQRQQYCAGTYARQYNLCLRSCRGR